MKTKVIEFFQNLPEAKHDQFNQAFALYRESEGKNPVAERNFNAQGYTPSSLENLLYDLQKMHGITDVEKVASSQVADFRLQVADSSEQVADSSEQVADSSEQVADSSEQVADSSEQVADSSEQVADLSDQVADSSEQVADFRLQVADSSEQVADSSEQVADLSDQVADSSEQVADLSDQVADLETEKEDLEFENLDLQSENEDLKKEVETLKLAPKLDAKSIRVEFPFLNEKECPDEFKILVADKITAWNSYLAFQEEIAAAESGEKPQTNEVVAIMANEAIKCFNENKLIYDELNCYQTTGKVLGVHPIFKKLQLTREIETMTADELIKYKNSSAKYFSVKKTALEKAKKAKDEAKVQEIEAAVAERSGKLFLVNKKLGV